MHRQSVVFIVAGEAAARRELAATIEPLEVRVRMCRSPEEFRQSPLPAGPACVLAEMPRCGDDNLPWLKRLGHRPQRLPVVVVAPRADVPMAVGAMKLGMFDFLEKKCAGGQLCEALRKALRWDGDNRRQLARTSGLRRRRARLTAGQREVLDRLLAGKSNREIAGELRLSVRAIEVRRAKVMAVMRAGSLAELVRLAIMAGSDGT